MERPNLYGSLRLARMGCKERQLDVGVVYRYNEVGTAREV